MHILELSKTFGTNNLKKHIPELLMLQACSIHSSDHSVLEMNKIVGELTKETQENISGTYAGSIISIVP